MTARERIVDAAASVLRTHGLAHATTKSIALEAGYSEAMLYKHFADKRELQLAVLRERPGSIDDPGDLVGRADVDDNLIDIVRQLMRHYVSTFPVTASVFASPALLAAWRDGTLEKGRGPRAPVRLVERYLESEIELGRIARPTDAAALAALITGAAFQNAFFACFDGLGAVPDEAALAARLIAALPL